MNGSLVLRKNDTSHINILPGVLGRAKRDIYPEESKIIYMKYIDHSNSKTKINKDQLIIIQPQQGCKDRYTITEYYKSGHEAGNLPESRKQIHVERILECRLTDPEQCFIFDEHYKRSEEPLFPTENSPSLSDISQGFIPNCGFLAQIQSILNHPEGAAFIRGMMKQNEDGTVVVRLFDHLSLKPNYVVVNPSILVDKDGRPKSHHKALWVHILESAFVAAYGKKNTDELNELIKKASATRDMFALSSIEPKGPSSALIFNKGINKSLALTILTGLRELHCIDIEYPNMMSRAYIYSCLDMFTGPKKAFSGTYTWQQNHYYSTIQSALEKGQIISAGSRAKTANKFPGIYNWHAYSVLKVFSLEEKFFDSTSKKESIREVKYVQLRNPWGKKGTVYNASGKCAYVGESAIFTLELVHFCENFRSIALSDSATPLFAAEKTKLILLSSINELISSMTIQASQTLKELCQQKKHYVQYEQKVCEIATLALTNTSSSDSFLVQKERELFDLYKFPSDSLYYRGESDLDEQAHLGTLVRIYLRESDDKSDLNFKRLYYLLKLHQIQSLETQEEATIKKAQSKFVRYADFDFCDQIKIKKNKLDIMAHAYKNNCMREIEAFNRQFSDLEKQLRLIDQNPSKATKTINAWEQLFQSFSNLQDRAIIISSMATSLNELDVDMSDVDLKSITSKINQIKPLFPIQEEYQALLEKYNYHRDLAVVHATNDYHQGSLCLDDFKKIETLIGSPDLPDEEAFLQLITEFENTHLNFLQIIIKNIYDFLKHAYEYIRELICPTPVKPSSSNGYFSSSSQSQDLVTNTYELAPCPSPTL